MGLVLVLLCGVAAGMAAAAQFRRRVRLLEQTVYLLQWLALHIRTTAQPLPRLLSRLSLQDDAPPFLAQVCERMRQGASAAQVFEAAVRGQAGYTEQDREILLHCTETLGRSDAAAQLESLHATCEQLQVQLGQARDACITRGRTVRVLGACSGAALFLLLI
jgi:stage III sporulation protein AB